MKRLYDSVNVVLSLQVARLLAIGARLSEYYEKIYHGDHFMLLLVNVIIGSFNTYDANINKMTVFH